MNTAAPKGKVVFDPKMQKIEKLYRRMGGERKCQETILLSIGVVVYRVG